jgi:hypothetical protein
VSPTSASSVQPVPTLSQWTLALLSLLILTFAAIIRKAHRQSTP